MKLNNSFTIRVATNGELLFDGLSPGHYEAADCVMWSLKELSDEGGMWPYQIILLDYDPWRNTWLFCVDEVG